jgi:hypothetical protein
VVTIGALTYGIANYYQGNRLMQQKMMRVRIAAQLFTIIAASSGFIYNIFTNKN